MSNNPNCNCLRKTSEKIVEEYCSREFIVNKETSSYRNINLLNDSLYAPFLLHYTHKSKHDIISVKTKEIGIHFRYCPFCGTEYTQDKEWKSV